MKKCAILFLLLSTFAIRSNAQETSVMNNLEDSLRVGWWDRNTQLSINFSQASFNDSWTGGGVNNFALGFLFNNLSVRHKRNGVWTNDLQFQYGFLNNKGLDTRKSVDRLFAESKYAGVLAPKINWFASINLLSQFTGGYNFDTDGTRGNLISSLFSPGFLSEGVGIEWKPQPFFSIQLGGATLRQTFVSNSTVFNNTSKLVKDKEGNAIETAYGVQKGKTLLNEMGIQFVAAFDKNLSENLNLKWRYQGFVAYAPQTKPMDHNINLIATSKVGKYFNVNFSLIGIYDADQVDEFQISQGLSAGFSLAL